MQFLYCSIKGLQSVSGSLDLEKSMQSSRALFSSLHTQHGCYEVSTLIPPAGKKKFNCAFFFLLPSACWRVVQKSSVVVCCRWLSSVRWWSSQMLYERSIE